ncbi:MAG: class I SAM-dependent methyltransferase [Thermoguttaceae bacterium]|jgi:ubiquinone/menaquinone biosynthesis C-methylase UbiE
MRLSDQEFRAMDTPLRRFLQRRMEFPVFRLLGLRKQNQDILEIGCGNGYGAALLMRLKPKSYVGVDLMPEMIELARKQPNLVNAAFLAMDAADLSFFPDGSKDVIVIFGILHHIPQWRQVLKECHCVLKSGGRLFLEEPNAAAIKLWDAIFKWEHPELGLFTWREMEEHLRSVGFVIRHRLGIRLFRSYCVEKS